MPDLGTVVLSLARRQQTLRDRDRFARAACAVTCPARPGPARHRERNSSPGPVQATCLALKIANKTLSTFLLAYNTFLMPNNIKLREYLNF